MMGQAAYFQRIAAPSGHQDDFMIKRYVNGSCRLMEVLDARLSGRERRVGGEMPIADIATYPRARSDFWTGVSVEGLAHLNAGFAHLDARPATPAAPQRPTPGPSVLGEGDLEAAARENAARFRTP